MGQKVKPISMRLQVNKDWRSKWFVASVNTPNIWQTTSPYVACPEQARHSALQSQSRH